MTRRKNDGNINKKNLIILGVLVFLLVAGIFIFQIVDGNSQKPAPTGIITSNTDKPGNALTPTPGKGNMPEETPLTMPEEELEVHFIDCGKADAIIVRSKGSVMLIDAGYNKDGAKIVSYLNTLGIDKIDVLVATHPHKDHIGGMDTVVKNMTIDKVYMPELYITSNNFKDLIKELNKKELTPVRPIVGEKFMLGEAECTFLGPIGNDYDEENDYSIVIKLRIGEKSILFTGDIETISERELVNSGYNISADVLKVPHHGNSGSTSAELLDLVKPEYAIITCDENDGSFLPNKDVLDRLNSRNIQVLRTDLNGTIVLRTDGKTIKFDN